MSIILQTVKYLDRKKAFNLYPENEQLWLFVQLQQDGWSKHAATPPAGTIRK